MSANEKRRRSNKNANSGSNIFAATSATTTTTSGGQQTASSAAAIIGWRSQSAPPRKKWYRRGASLLSRQRSTHQSEVPACSMLYDQMVSRRLVGAIAAWHDLHASLLQLSLSRQAEQEEGKRRSQRSKRKEDFGSRISSDSMSSGSSLANRNKRLSSKAGSMGRKPTTRRPSQPLKKAGPGSSKCRHGAKGEGGCRLHGERRNESANDEGEEKEGNTEGRIPLGNNSRDSTSAGLRLRGSHPADSTKHLSTNQARTPSRSSSMSASSSGAGDGFHRMDMDRPDIDEDLLTPVPTAASSSWHQGEDSFRLGLVSAASNFHRAKIGSKFGSEKSSTTGVPAAATWSATFAQSLKIRSTSTRRRARSPIPRARSPAATTRQIVIKHSVKLLQQPTNEQSQAIPAEWLPTQNNASRKSQQKSPALSKSPPPPALLSLARRSVSSAATAASKGALFRQGGRCFSVAKVVEERRPRNEREEECSCWSEGAGSGGGDGKEDEEEYGSADEEVDDDEEWEEESGASSGLLSDAELDSLYEQERNRPKLSMSSPELTPDQLKQLFPELSDHWRILLASGNKWFQRIHYGYGNNLGLQCLFFQGQKMCLDCEDKIGVILN